MLLEYITEWINEHPLLIEYVLNPCLGVLYSEAWDCLLHTEAGEYSSATTGYRPTNGIFHMRIERRCQFVRFYLKSSIMAKIMRGDLKDASDWCTEIRVITEKADSLINNWNKVDRYSYDYNYLYWWYQKRSADFNMYDYDLAGQINTAFNIVKESKEKFDLLSSLLDKPKDDVYFYVVSHTYSIVNPLIKKKITQTDNVYFDANYNYVKYEPATNFNDILDQVAR